MEMKPAIQHSEPKPDENKITCRLRNQVEDLETAVSEAKREAVRLFQELDARAKKAKTLASSLEGDSGNPWARRVSKLMDILDSCRGTMEGMAAIGLLRNSSGFSWDLEKVFDESENDRIPG
jgi:hypothetical protein